MVEDILRLKGVADYLKVKGRTLCRLAQEGMIRAFGVEASWRFARADIDVSIEAQKPAAERVRFGEEG